MKSDKLFSEDLANSQPAVLVVAEWMRQRMPPEVEVKVPEIVERPTYEERGDYLDDGGFFVIDKDDVIRYLEYVEEMASHPDYDGALNALKEIA